MSEQWQPPPPGIEASAPHSMSPQPPPVGSPLPSRWTRLGAFVIDGVAELAVCSLVVGVAAVLGFGDWGSWWGAWLRDDLSSMWPLLFFLVSAANQVVGLGQRGRTVGKALLRLRVADVHTGAEMSWRASGIRWALISPITWVPVAGPIFAFIDVLLLFRSDRRAIHDHAAGTVVLHT